MRPSVTLEPSKLPKLCPNLTALGMQNRHRPRHPESRSTRIARIEEKRLPDSLLKRLVRVPKDHHVRIITDDPTLHRRRWRADIDDMMHHELAAIELNHFRFAIVQPGIVVP